MANGSSDQFGGNSGGAGFYEEASIPQLDKTEVKDIPKSFKNGLRGGIHLKGDEGSGGFGGGGMYGFGGGGGYTGGNAGDDIAGGGGGSFNCDKNGSNLTGNKGPGMCTIRLVTPTNF